MLVAAVASYILEKARRPPNIIANWFTSFFLFFTCEIKSGALAASVDIFHL